MVSPLSVKELRVVKNKAREFIKSRQIEKALIIYARILKLFPDDLESLLMLGDACLVRRDREKAVKFYARAYELASWREDIVRRLEIANEPLETTESVETAEDDAVVTSDSTTMEESEPETEAEAIQLVDVQVKHQEQDEETPAESIEQPEMLAAVEEESAVQDEIEDEPVFEEHKPSAAPIAESRNNGLKNIPFDDLVNSLPEDFVPVSKEELKKKIPIDQIRKKISDVDVQQANDLMDTIIKSRSPSTIVAEHLDEIDQLLPALIELNIRQTRTQGRADLAEALEDILSDVLFDVEGFEEEDEKLKTQPVNINLDTAPKIIIDGVNSKESPFRLYHIQSALQHAGFNISGISNLEDDEFDLHEADYVLLHNPHCKAKYVKMLAERAGMNKPTIVDFDIDFRNIPIHHADYISMGMSSPEQYRAFTTVLQLADLITVSSEQSAQRFQNEGLNVLYMPEMWNEANELWLKKSKPRDTLNIGIMAVTGQLSDIAEVRRGIVRIIREFPNTRLVVSGDADAYRLFDSLSEDRKAFYPDVEPDDYPFMLSQMDIILSPYEINELNHHHSDRILMEAGIKGIPWIASPIASYQKWNVGGILAESIEDWYFSLKKLILDPESRMQLGSAGLNHAAKREVKQLSGRWEEALMQMFEVA
jgi:glycosyltransferase involved in cell wall biosynthesis